MEEIGMYAMFFVCFSSGASCSLLLIKHFWILSWLYFYSYFLTNPLSHTIFRGKS